MKEIRFAYPLDLVERIANYLATKPYAEVVQLLEGLRAGVRVEVDISGPDEPKAD
jgi:hypothetical protein